MSAYDEVLYVNKPYVQTHPDRLAVLARLHGMNPPSVETARVLDIGASEGGNIIPMALTLPRAQFTGIDLAAVPVEAGMRVVRDLGLANVRLQQMNLLDLDKSFGEFDYIIAHGLYAWTPPEVRSKLLAVVRANMSTEGVAFISYNTHPAGHLRRMLRDMMLFRIGDATEPAVRLERARQILEMLAGRKAIFKNVEAGVALEAEEILKLPDSALFHDYLAPFYEPVHVSEFAAHAERHGLAYLADAEVMDERRYQFEPALLDRIKQLAGPNRVDREQYFDFMRFRRFRQTLVCHQEATVEEKWKPERAIGMYVASRASEKEGGAFQMPGGASVTTKHPAVLEFLRGLARIWPESLQVSAREAELCLEMMRGGVVELRTEPGLARRAGSHPKASALALYQARRGEQHITSLDHHALKLEDESARKFLLLLDSTHDLAALAEKMECDQESARKRLVALERCAVLLA